MCFKTARGREGDQNKVSKRKNFDPQSLFPIRATTWGSMPNFSDIRKYHIVGICWICIYIYIAHDMISHCMPVISPNFPSWNPPFPRLKLAFPFFQTLPLLGLGSSSQIVPNDGRVASSALAPGTSSRVRRRVRCKSRNFWVAVVGSVCHGDYI